MPVYITVWTGSDTHHRPISRDSDPRISQTATDSAVVDLDGPADGSQQPITSRRGRLANSNAAPRPELC